MRSNLTLTYFIFNGIIYKQTFGISMSSPLLPIISDIVIGEFGRENVKFFSGFCILYIDDIFMIIPKDKVIQILNLFNEQHDRLKFIIEYEEDHCLNFLNLSVINKGNIIILDWYHKKMFSEVFIFFYSNHHPACHNKKIGTIA